MLMRPCFVALAIFGLLLPARGGGAAKHVVLVVWDGMRPDFVSPELTPALWQLRTNGTWFARHHSVFPTSTEVNGAALATGAHPQRSGILANNEFRPAINAAKAFGTQELDVIRKGDALTQGRYLAAPTLAELVQSGRRTTAIAGSKAVALFHDRAERTPDNTRGPVLFADDALPRELWPQLTNRFGSPPASASPNSQRDEWTTRCLIEQFWADTVPVFSVLWLSEPDVTQHRHGPGAKTSLEAIRGSDRNLALVLRELERRGLRDQTDVMVVSDHGFSTVDDAVDVVKNLNRAGLKIFRSFTNAPNPGDTLLVVNGGAVMLYVHGHLTNVIQQTVATLQRQSYPGVIFTRAGLPGTFPLGEVRLDAPHAPDIIVSMRWEAAKSGTGTPGLLTRDGERPNAALRGMHTSLAPADLFNLCVAAGPDFRAGFTNNIATGNIDVMPTLSRLLGIQPPPATDGRVMIEALAGVDAPPPHVEQKKLEAGATLAGGTWSQYLAFTEVNGVRYLDAGNGQFVPAAADTAPAILWLDQLTLSQTQQDWGKPQRNKSVDGKPLTVGGQTFERGLGTHAASTLEIKLNGGSRRFTAMVGVDDEAKGQPGSVEFKVVGDGKPLWASDVMRVGTPAKAVDVELAGVQHLALLVTDAGDGINFDHADWCDAKFEVSGDKPMAVTAPNEEPYILTPKPPPSPRINGARVIGCRPGRDFLFTIAATGERPMTFAAKNLPPGLQLAAATGIITGKVSQRGDYKVTLTAKNARGTAQRELKIICGDQIALTPPMGWNSWNCFASAVSAEKVKAAADAMVNSGLTQHGWTYINIDDFWEQSPGAMGTDPSLGGPGRDAQGRIVPNPRFPDMKSLADYVHGKGLKMGIYSSPGPFTCGGCLGSFEHEELDAQSYGAWGIDYLKYDWCSYKPEMEAQRGTKPDFSGLKQFWGEPKEKKLDELIKPYAVMQAALDKVDRDIVFSLCQYGMGDVWEWGGRVGGNCWRTTHDITDTWRSMAGIGFEQAGLAKFARPGNWNDPDMLVVGKVGWGPALHPTRLTPSEQYTHITLWSLLCSPLLIGCDMTQMDDFTLSLLTNDEVLEVNQDPLGQAAGRIAQSGQTEVWAKKMEDGSYAVGLFNRGPAETEVIVNWSDLGLKGSHKVRDLWRQQDLGKFADGYKVSVRRHGAVLVRVW